MKKKIFLAAAMMIGCTASFAEWVEPTFPVPETCELQTTTVDEAASATAYYLYNVEGKAFYGHANTWNTRASLVAYPFTYYCSERKNNQTAEPMQVRLANDSSTGFYGIFGSEYTSTDGAESVWVDGKRNGWNQFSITPTQDNNFTIGNTKFADCLLGVLSTNTTEVLSLTSAPVLNFYNPSNVEDGVTLYNTWALVTVDAYNTYSSEVKEYVAKTKQYEAAVALKNKWDVAKASYPEADYSAVEKVYNNTESTTEQLTEALKLVDETVAKHVLSGATADNPVDGTQLLENADFSARNINGWTNTFVSGQTANNVGYNGWGKHSGQAWSDSETGDSGTATLNEFIEAWAANEDAMKRDGRTFATIGDAKLCQTLYGLPAGKYRLSCDAIAVQQYEASQNPVSGVQLYVLGGEIDSHLDMATGNGVPEHFILTFIHSGGDVELGLRTKSTTANWIAADNFTLMYYGEFTENAYQLQLKQAVATAESEFADLNQTKANASVKLAYETALSNAKAAQDGQNDEYYTNLQTQLETAIENLKASIRAYKAIAATLTAEEARVNSMPETWTSLRTEFATQKSAWQSQYEVGQLADDANQTITTEVDKMIANYIRQNASSCKSLTFLLQNPGFDKDVTGWTLASGSATLAWGGCKKNPNGDLTGHSDLESYRETGLSSGCAEVFRKAFDVFQTIYLPAGIYEITCNAFERDANSHKDAELYAKFEGNNEQSVKVMGIYDDVAPMAIYQYGQEKPDGSNSASSNGGYVPDGMSSANWHFAAGYYMNRLCIVVAEDCDITIGIRTTSGTDWVLFDNFKLTYYGNSVTLDEASESAPTATVANVSVTLNRTLTSGFNTLCLPFALDETQVQEAFGNDVKVYTLSDETDNGNDNYTLNFTEGTAVTANTPCILSGVSAEKAASSYNFSGVTLQKAENAVSSTAHFDFIGTYAAGTVPVGDYFLKKGSSEIVRSVDNPIKAFRAYFSAKKDGQTNEVAAFRLQFGDMETGIEDVMGAEDEATEVYDLSGRRVNAKQRGIYIANGKKIWVK